MNPVAAPREAFAVLDAFTAAFNRQDAAGMDATLHFPHVFAGKTVAVWDRPGSLRADFFPQLVESGWAFSRYTGREVLLATAERVHFLVEYDRCRADGSVLGHHSAIWVVALLDDRWGLQVRSNQ